MFLLASRTWFSDRIHLQNFLFRLHPSIPFLSSSIDVCQEKFINKAPKDTFIFMFWYFIKNCWLTQSAHSPLHSSHKIDVIFGNPFPFTHPCACPLRKKTCRFYDHLGFTLECRMSLLAYQTFMCRGCKISVVPPSDLLRVSHVTQPSNRPTLPDNQRPHRTFLLGYRQDFIYREYSTY